MKIAFYKAFQPRATKMDVAVALASLGRHSHVELIFNDGTSFAISPRDGGARFKKIKYHPEAWDIYTLDITAQEQKEIKKEAEKYTDYGYDYVGALSTLLPICIQQNKKLFCSQLAVDLLKEYKSYETLGKGCRYSPVDLHECLKIKK